MKTKLNQNKLKLDLIKANLNLRSYRLRYSALLLLPPLRMLQPQIWTLPLTSMWHAQ